MFLKGSSHPSVEGWQLMNCTSAYEGSILQDYGNASVSNLILTFDTTQHNQVFNLDILTLEGENKMFP